MCIFKWFLWVFFFCFSNLLLAEVDPSIQIQETSQGVLEILYSGMDDQEDDILAYLKDSYNLEIIIRRSLGRNWNKIDIEHQATIVDLIQKLVVRAYIDGMKGKSKPNIQYSNTRFISAKRAEVPSIVYVDNKSIHLTYRVGFVNERWEIFDIVIENLSIVLTYRKQFDSFFTNNSSEDLIDKLQILLTNENLGKSLPL